MSQRGTRQASYGRGGAAFLALMTLGYAVYAADRTVLTAVLVPMTSALGLSNVQQGLLVSAQYVGVLAVVFAAGFLSDRYGRWRIIFLGVAIFSLFTWLIAFSADFYQAFAFRLASGVGEGMFWPVAMAAVADRFGQSKGLALGAFYVGFDLGGAGGTAVAGATFALTSDWRVAFLVAPLLGVAVLAGIAAARGTIAAPGGGYARLALGRGAFGVAKGRDMAVILIFALLVTYPTAAWQSFLPTYLKRVLGLDIPSAAFGTSAVLIAGGAGKVILGRASDRARRGRMVAGLCAVSLAGYVVFFSTNNVVLGLASGLVVGFFSSAIFPVMQAMAADKGGGRRGTALGLTTTFQSVATVFSPTITALFFPQGVGSAVAYNVVVPMVAVLAVALFLRDKRSEPAPHSA